MQIQDAQQRTKKKKQRTKTKNTEQKTKSREQRIGLRSTCSLNNMSASIEAVPMTVWYCWCSTKNLATCTSCKTCTAPYAGSNLDNEDPINAPNLLPVDDADSDSSDASAAAPSPKERRLALVVRSDISAGAGKIATQCCLATLSACWREKNNDEKNNGEPAKNNEEWTTAEQMPKIVLACDDDVAMSKIRARATVCGIQCEPTNDETSGERTVLAIGPATANQLSVVIGHLKVWNWQKQEKDDLKSETETESDPDSTRGEGMERKELAGRRKEILGLISRVMTEDISSLPASMHIKKKKMKPNDKCDCGSGKKYKKCCATKITESATPVISLKKLVVEALAKGVDVASGKDSGTAQGTCSAESKIDQFQGPTNGEKVLGFRKQVEYGAKKYIKP